MARPNRLDVETRPHRGPNQRELSGRSIVVVPRYVGEISVVAEDRKLEQASEPAIRLAIDDRGAQLLAAQARPGIVPVQPDDGHLIERQCLGLVEADDFCSGQSLDCAETPDDDATPAQILNGQSQRRCGKRRQSLGNGRYCQRDHGL